MKTIIRLLIFILLFAMPAYGGMVLNDVTAVAACSTPDNGDELDEGFLGTGYENAAAFSEEVNTGSVDEDFTLSGSPPTDSCSEGLNVIATASVNMAIWDRGSVFARAGDLDIVCEVYVDSMTIDAWDIGRFLQWDNDTAGSSTDGPGWIEIQEQGSDGVYYFRGRGADTSSSVAMSIDTWYTVRLHLDGATAASSYFQCDECVDSAQKTFTRKDTNDGRYLLMGGISGWTGTEALDIEFGYCYVNSP